MRANTRTLLVAALAVALAALLAGCAGKAAGREETRPGEPSGPVAAPGEEKAAAAEAPATVAASGGGSSSATKPAPAEGAATEAATDAAPKAGAAAPATAPAGTALRSAEAKEKDMAWAEAASPEAPAGRGGGDGEGTRASSGASGTTGAAPTAAPRPQAEASGLRAGYADDNKQFNYFVQFLDKYAGDAPHLSMDIQERIILRVRDSGGQPVVNAEVSVLAGQDTLLRAQSSADGTVLFFPRLYAAAERYRVLTTALGSTVETLVEREGRREVEIAMPSQRRLAERVPLDVIFILDTTGSMGEEIERLKLTIELINLNLTSVSTNPVVRFGLVLYKDVGDDYVTQVVQPTDDLAAFQESLAGVYADGGGDTPEDLQSALRDAVTRISWNRDGIRLAFVVTDAPPHLDYGDPYTYVDASREAQQKGIKIFSVGTGGLDIAGEYVLRQVSQFTYAKYIFLTYGEQTEAEGGVAGSVSHHTGANFQTDKLESIIIRFAREELAFQSAKPLEEGEEYFEATKVTEEDKAQTLGKLFDMAIGQLVDYSSVRVAGATRAASVPLVAADTSLAAQAEYMSEQLVLSLSRSSAFRMVERQDLQKILEEMELQLSGLVDDSKAAKVGNILGAEMLVTGRLYAKEEQFELFLKLLRVETGEILSVTKARVDRKLGI